MIYFIIAIALSASIYLLFKYVGAKQHHLATVVLFNYIVCVAIGCFGLLFKESSVVIDSKLVQSTSVMGLLFISMFYLMGLLTNKSGVAVSSIISRVSLVIPALFFYFVWGEKLSALAITGIFVAIASIVLVNKRRGQALKFNSALPFIVFVGYGVVDVGLKLSQHHVQESGAVQHELTLGIFLFAGIYGWLIKFIKKIPLQKESIAIGLVLGLVNYFSIYFFFLALEQIDLAVTVIFPINGISIMLLATVLSSLLFRETISANKIVALVLAVISIVLLSN
ncbi:MAG: EamA family transporter [Bacteroidia bacterium]